MKMKELHERTKEELTSLLADKKMRIDELRFLVHKKKIKDVKEFSRIKKDIARILTILQGMAER